MGLGAAFKVAYKRVRCLLSSEAPCGSICRAAADAAPAASCLPCASSRRGHRARPDRAHLAFRPSYACSPAASTVTQRALNDESANQVSINFFGDGTANNGAPRRVVLVSVHTLKHLVRMGPGLDKCTNSETNAS